MAQLGRARGARVPASSLPGRGFPPAITSTGSPPAREVHEPAARHELVRDPQRRARAGGEDQRRVERRARRHALRAVYGEHAGGPRRLRVARAASCGTRSVATTSRASSAATAAG